MNYYFIWQTLLSVQQEQIYSISIYVALNNSLKSSFDRLSKAPKAVLENEGLFYD